jgi:hypothetical protein
MSSEQITNDVVRSTSQLTLRDFVIPRIPVRDYLGGQITEGPGRRLPASGEFMRQMTTSFLFLGLLALGTVPAAAEEEFKLNSNQRVSCGRGLSPGKLATSTCKSYAYLFNVKTSEYFRCTVSLAVTRDSKEVINVQSDGGCAKRPRIFDADSRYEFDAAETEPPNTNSFFGPGGYAVWASDTTAQKLRGCIIIASGLGSDVTRCVDMTFN